VVATIAKRVGATYASLSFEKIAQPTRTDPHLATEDLEGGVPFEEVVPIGIDRNRAGLVRMAVKTSFVGRLGRSPALRRKRASNVLGGVRAPGWASPSHAKPSHPQKGLMAVSVPHGRKARAGD
jgi:hypothetical protein